MPSFASLLRFGASDFTASTIISLGSTPSTTAIPDRNPDTALASKVWTENPAIAMELCTVINPEEVGAFVGAVVGESVGFIVGTTVGASVGAGEGTMVGIVVGAGEGTAVGTGVGALVHC